jgi:hypothetical protein
MNRQLPPFTSGFVCEAYSIHSRDTHSLFLMLILRYASFHLRFLTQRKRNTAGPILIGASFYPWSFPELPSRPVQREHGARSDHSALNTLLLHTTVDDSLPSLKKLTRPMQEIHGCAIHPEGCGACGHTGRIAQSLIPQGLPDPSNAVTMPTKGHELP